jgi:hypothetical protein
MADDNQLKAAAIDDVPVFQTDLVPGSDVLIVSFSGLFGVFNKERPFDFFMTTSMLSYHRIMLRDPYGLFYLRGIDENGFEHLLERLRGEIKRIAPRKIIFIGASAGAFAAVLLGHLLDVDYIHGFAARGHFKLIEMIRQQDYKSLFNRLPTMLKLRMKLPPEHRAYLDLKPLLNSRKGAKTLTNLHACAFCVDANRVGYLRGCPNTTIFLYPCNDHNVAKILVKSKCLHEMLQVENLATPQAVYEKFYGDFDPKRPEN